MCCPFFKPMETGFSSTTTSAPTQPGPLRISCTAQQFWDLLQTQLNRVVPRPTTVADLDLTNIPRQASNTLVRSMHRRCQAVIDANGGHTRY
ncbi:hypothetical protein V1264_008582 [Littorina saxatilis]|uniref:Uncharacterized protein n=1 Tax=Littorina saxatilis TaxID=31220 RepID=A0AAN9ATD3_9CAEN